MSAETSNVNGPSRGLSRADDRNGMLALIVTLVITIAVFILVAITGDLISKNRLAARATQEMRDFNASIVPVTVSEPITNVPSYLDETRGKAGVAYFGFSAGQTDHYLLIDNLNPLGCAEGILGRVQPDNGIRDEAEFERLKHLASPIQGYALRADGPWAPMHNCMTAWRNSAGLLTGAEGREIVLIDTEKLSNPTQ